MTRLLPLVLVLATLVGPAASAAPVRGSEESPPARPAVSLGPARLTAPGPGRPAPGPRGVWPLSPTLPGPTPPAVVHDFRAPTTRWGAGHRGVDLLGAPGQEVRAAAAGEVVFVGRVAGRGVVVVSHGATRTTYEPVTPDVQLGTSVRPGTRLGRLELLGSHCLPQACLHWGLLRGETYLDPLTLVGSSPVRLLPWL